MSLACFECLRSGSFNTLIIFSKDGKFDPEKPVSHYSSFYTDCAKFEDFRVVKASRFMVVEEKGFQDSWNTGTDGDTLRETRHKLVNDVALAARLPRIFGELLKII